MCILHQITLEVSNQIGWDGRDTEGAYGEDKWMKKCYPDNLKERDRLGCLGEHDISTLPTSDYYTKRQVPEGNLFKNYD
jgi:hypothetical protein